MHKTVIEVRRGSSKRGGLGYVSLLPLACAWLFAAVVPSVRAQVISDGVGAGPQAAGGAGPTLSVKVGGTGGMTSDDVALVLVGAPLSITVTLANPRAQSAYSEYLLSDRKARADAARSGEVYTPREFKLPASEAIRLPAAAGGWGDHVHLSLLQWSNTESNAKGVAWLTDDVLAPEFRKSLARYPSESELSGAPVFATCVLHPKLLAGVGDGTYVVRVQYDSRFALDAWQGTVSADSAPLILRRATSIEEKSALEQSWCEYSASLGKHDEVVVHAQQLVANQPDWRGGLGYSYLGDAFAAQGKTALAVEAWKRFLELQPKNTTSHRVAEVRKRIWAAERETVPEAQAGPK